MNKWDLVKKDSNTMRDFEEEIRKGCCLPAMPRLCSSLPIPVLLDMIIQVNEAQSPHSHRPAQ